MTIAALDAVSQRDRYQQFSRTARELLSDFREVAENFRRLDRSLREQIAGWTGSKGALLDEALGSRSSIAESDQGRSFQALYDFLLSHQRQSELTDLLERLGQIDHLAHQDERLARVHFDWLDDTAVSVNLPTERPLCRRSRATPIDSTSIRAGREDFDSSPLLNQRYVDREELAQRVRAALSRRDQVGLREVVAG